jgi:hypothetical protein
MNLTRGTVSLNPQLVENQNLTQADVDGILDLHDERIELFEKFEFASILPKSFVQEMVLELEDLEYIMQASWGFKQNRNMHTWWNRVPGCTCSKSQDFQPERKIDKNCPIHG